MATKEEVISLLYEIHEELARYYLKKLRKGELTSQDQKNLIQFLKDNHINTEVRKGTPLEELLNEDFSLIEDLSTFN